MTKYENAAQYKSMIFVRFPFLFLLCHKHILVYAKTHKNIKKQQKFIYLKLKVKKISSSVFFSK